MIYYTSGTVEHRLPCPLQVLTRRLTAPTCMLQYCFTAWSHTRMFQPWDAPVLRPAAPCLKINQLKTGMIVQIGHRAQHGVNWGT